MFKNLTLDVRRYKHLKMFVHANSVDGALPLGNKEVSAFIRIGSDFKDNYYEYEVPLHVTQPRAYDNSVTADRDSVWPEENSIDIELQNSFR